jgi:hypothetical protein
VGVPPDEAGGFDGVVAGWRGGARRTAGVAAAGAATTALAGRLATTAGATAFEPAFRTAAAWWLWRAWRLFAGVTCGIAGFRSITGVFGMSRLATGRATSAF